MLQDVGEGGNIRIGSCDWAGSGSQAFLGLVDCTSSVAVGSSRGVVPRVDVVVEAQERETGDSFDRNAGGNTVGDWLACDRC